MALVVSLAFTLPTYVVIGPTFIAYCVTSANGKKLLPDFVIYALSVLSFCAEYFYLASVLGDS